MKGIYLSCCRARACGFPLSRPLNAQAVPHAQIHGVISDPSGAVVGGAQIKAVQTDTAGVRSAVSNIGQRVHGPGSCAPRLALIRRVHDEKLDPGLDMAAGLDVSRTLAITPNVPVEVTLYASADLNNDESSYSSCGGPAQQSPQHPSRLFGVIGLIGVCSIRVKAYSSSTVSTSQNAAPQQFSGQVSARSTAHP